MTACVLKADPNTYIFFQDNAVYYDKRQLAVFCCNKQHSFVVINSFLFDLLFFLNVFGPSNYVTE